MEVYKRETQKTIKRFLRFHLSFGGCIHALDAALARLIPRMNPEDLPALRALMLANNEIVVKEMKRRGEMGPHTRTLRPKIQSNRVLHSLRKRTLNHVLPRP
jgi:hypothetical protein